MTDRMQLNLEPQARFAPEVLDDPCPRCGSQTVRAIVYGPLDFEVEVSQGEVDLGAFIADAPIFDCRDCGFEWGLAVRELLG
ncbi:hypothetical protein [Agromyces sp. LHK192]|uniref:hypothetical protein n=1 Tax=Agromyces sp. LHK192 TaxID=2498704 RepID=UPI000FDC2D46|nr:hypothetical protein [Agromyces sp. LHK192]